jgi:ABC-2 type transport system ATP-binding protein
VFGEDPFKHRSIAQRIGLCPANDLLVQGATARQWIQLQLALSGWSSHRAADRAAEVLDAVGMSEAMDRPISGYSLGMRQRCKLAQAIANDPDLLILDEPFNGLDPVGRHQMGQFLRDWGSSGKSILLASHVLHEVEKITSSFLLIYGGRLLASGTSTELRHLLAGLPQEIELKSSTLDRLAQKLSAMPWLRVMERSVDRSTLRVSVEKPLELYQALAEWVEAREVSVEQMTGAEGEISALFHLLVSKHRGEVMMTGVAS